MQNCRKRAEFQANLEFAGGRGANREIGGRKGKGRKEVLPVRAQREPAVLGRRRGANAQGLPKPSDVCAPHAAAATQIRTAVGASSPNTIIRQLLEARLQQRPSWCASRSVTFGQMSCSNVTLHQNSSDCRQTQANGGQGCHASICMSAVAVAACAALQERGTQQLQLGAAFDRVRASEWLSARSRTPVTGAEQHGAEKASEAPVSAVSVVALCALAARVAHASTYPAARLQCAPRTVEVAWASCTSFSSL